MRSHSSGWLRLLPPLRQNGAGQPQLLRCTHAMPNIATRQDMTIRPHWDKVGMLTACAWAVKLAVTAIGLVTAAKLHVAPLQSPLQPLKTKPAFAVAVQVEAPPSTTMFAVQLTVPPLGGLRLR